MDPYSNSGTEGSVSNPKESSLNVGIGPEKDAYLSTVTAKYKMSRSGPNFVRNDTIPVQGNENCFVAGSKSLTTLESKRSNPSILINCNSNNSSSEEDNSSDSGDMSGFSLAALVAKNRMSKSNIEDHPDIARKGTISKDPVLAKNKMEESSSDSSDNEGFSLHMLASKYKSSQMSGSSLNAIGPSFLSSEITSSKEFNCSKSEKDLNVIRENTLTGTLVSDCIETNPIKYVNKSDERISCEFVTAKFSDDSDSDEIMSLAGLVSNHKKSAMETGSVDMRHLKPRNLTKVASCHRYHTKSESDSFSASSQLAASNLKKELDNETSISLGSLKGVTGSGNGFQFSLGCTIPNSFKSNHFGSSLTSSMKSLRMVSPQTSCKNSQSDPDVSVKSPFNKPISDTVLQFENPTPDDTDIGFGGINLSCAIKTPSITKSSEHAFLQIDSEISNDPEELEIMTLLDQLDVEDEKEDFEDKMEEDCTYDATYILKVKMKLRTKKCSSFGKVICRQWKPVYAPYIKKECFKTTVVPFTFSTLSPDDEVASYRSKRH